MHCWKQKKAFLLIKGLQQAETLEACGSKKFYILLDKELFPKQFERAFYRHYGYSCLIHIQSSNASWFQVSGFMFQVIKIQVSGEGRHYVPQN
jgi:hypothetical protein